VSYLATLQVKNFKAIRDSGPLKLGALTVFIGNNGAGKSSALEALQVFRDVVLDGLDSALAPFNGLAHLAHKGRRLRVTKAQIDPDKQIESVSIALTARMDAGRFKGEMALNTRGPQGLAHDYIQREAYQLGGVSESRDAVLSGKALGEGRSVLTPLRGLRPAYESIERWQFITLEPTRMGAARPATRVRGRVQLAHDGSNLAGYLLDLSERAPDAFNGVVEAMQFVLPYARDIRPVLPQGDIDRRVYLELAERDFRIPSWLFSSGTLRLLALLALLRDPEGPPVIFVEEIENGLDPRTIGLVVEEIRRAVENKGPQVIVTTHSPYLLDQLLFEHVIVVERNAQGEPEFWRPEHEAALASWAERFSPGQIYAMGQMRREPAQKTRGKK
jgi:predicted ATPase